MSLILPGIDQISRSARGAQLPDTGTLGYYESKRDDTHIHMNPRFSQGELSFPAASQYYLKTNRLRPRIRAIQIACLPPYCARVL
jgi:hypothetical protein